MQPYCEFGGIPFSDDTLIAHGVCHVPLVIERRGPFTRFVLPMVRRVFPAMLASEIVSVQPMTVPEGLLWDLQKT